MSSVELLQAIAFLRIHFTFFWFLRALVASHVFSPAAASSATLLSLWTMSSLFSKQDTMLIAAIVAVLYLVSRHFALASACYGTNECEA